MSQSLSALPVAPATTLEAEVLKHLKSKGLREADMGQELSRIQRTGISVAVVSGEPNRDAGSLRHGLTVLIDVIVKCIRDDGESVRRKEAHQLVQAILLELTNKTFGPEFHPLNPRPWAEITTPQEMDAHLMHVEMRFATGYVLDLDDPDLPNLQSVVARIYQAEVGLDPNTAPAVSAEINLESET